MLAIGAVLVTVVLGCGGKKESPAVVIADPLAESLAHAPADAAVLAVVDTRPRSGPSAALARLVAKGLGGGVIGADDGASAGGGLDTGTVVVWSPDGSAARRFTARVLADGRLLGEQLDRREKAGALARQPDDGDYAVYRERQGGALARRGPVLVSAPDLPQLQAVLRRRRDRRAQWTPTLLRQRTLGLPQGAIARVALDAQPLLRSRPAALRLPWVAALRRVALTISPEVGVLRLRARASVAPGVAPADLPLAVGAQPPVPRGAAPLVAGIRDPRQTIGFARRATELLDPGALQDLDSAQELLDRYAGVDLQKDVIDQLTGTATLTSRDGRRFTLRSDLQDPGRTQDALGRLGTLSRFGGPLARLAGVDLGGFALDEQDGTYTLERDDRLVLRLAVVDGALVASNDPAADLQAAGRAPAGRPAPADGALRATLTRAFLADGLLPRLGTGRVPASTLASFGNALLLARGAPDGLDAQLIVPVRGTP